MILVGIAQSITAAVVASLTFNSCRNMIETFQVVRSNDFILTPDEDVALPSTIQRLQSLQRSELLKLYINDCIIPDEKTCESVIMGDWDGVLLPNNGLTTVTSFITNRLFGRGHRWNGKSFNTATKQGVNRFIRKDMIENKQQSTVLSGNSNILNEHKFDFNIEETRMPIRRESSSSSNNNVKSVVIRYNKYQPPLSLWKTMIDEVRVLPSIPDESEIEILIGFGSMAWSGGVLNSSPFCLYRNKKYIDQQ